MANIDNELMIVNTATPSMWVMCFIADEAEAPAKIAEYEEQDHKDLVTFTEYAERYDREYWNARLETLKKHRYEVMNWEQYHKRQREMLVFQAIEEITEERFHDQLNCLPPICWTTINGIEMFCMSEMWTATYTSQYARVGNRYFTTMVDVRDRSTWIHNRLEDLPKEETNQ